MLREDGIAEALKLCHDSVAHPGINATTLSGQKYFNTFKLCHMVEICMPLKLFVLKITSNVLVYLIIG